MQIGVISQGIVKGCCSGLGENPSASLARCTCDGHTRRSHYRPACGAAGFFILQASGQGRLLLSSFGSIIRYDVAPGERRTIDNGFLVAWTSTMNYEARRADASSSTWEAPTIV